MKKKPKLIHSVTAVVRLTTGLDTVASSWLSNSYRSERGQKGAAAAARQSFLPTPALQPLHPAQPVPESPYSVSTVTFTFSYSSVRFLPQTSYQPPKTLSPCFLPSMMSLHCPTSSVSTHCSQLLQCQHPGTMQPLIYHQFQPLENCPFAKWTSQYLLPQEQLPVASLLSPTVLYLHILFHPWTIPSPQQQYLTTHSHHPQ